MEDQRNSIPRPSGGGQFLGDATVKPLRNHIASAIDMTSGLNLRGLLCNTTIHRYLTLDVEMFLVSASLLIKD